MGLNWNRLDNNDKRTVDRSDLKNYNIIANDYYFGGEQALAA